MVDRNNKLLQGINPMNTLSRDLIPSRRSCLENEISAWEFEGSWMFRLRTHKLRIRAFQSWVWIPQHLGQVTFLLFLI